MARHETPPLTLQSSQKHRPSERNFADSCVLYRTTPLLASSSEHEDLREIEWDEIREVEVGSCIDDLYTQVVALFSLPLRLESSITATMVARVSDLRAGQELLSSAVFHHVGVTSFLSNGGEFFVGR